MGFWIASWFLLMGLASVPLSSKAGRLGMRFARDGVVVPGEIVDIEKSRTETHNRVGPETIEERSSPVVAYRTTDGRDMRASAVLAVAHTVATRRNGEFVANSRRGQWGGRSWNVGEIVQVRYLPDEPSRFRVEGRPGSYLLWLLPLSLSTLSTAIGLTILIVELF
ncbi:DUF3592 domain-containing protein [Nocardia sp. NBC_00511]|uniref:DUF3592 domain-containing protein n=1 Tax=Nocardia sp. NBC_00511 TaxID=2903591 RepID=UPI0030E08237